MAEQYTPLPLKTGSGRVRVEKLQSVELKGRVRSRIRMQVKLRVRLKARVTVEDGYFTVV